MLKERTASHHQIPSDTKEMEMVIPKKDWSFILSQLKVNGVISQFKVSYLVIKSKERRLEFQFGLTLLSGVILQSYVRYLAIKPQ